MRITTFFGICAVIGLGILLSPIFAVINDFIGLWK